MAKQSLYGSGKQAIQQTSHIRSTVVPNGNQGFREASLGGDTRPGPDGGAPLSSQTVPTISVHKGTFVRGNPNNAYVADGPGVLKADVNAAAPATDSPVPADHQMPLKDMASKAAEVSVAAAPEQNSFPGAGVMHR